MHAYVTPTLAVATPPEPLPEPSIKTMSLSLDHIVIAINDLETTITDYTALGFKVQLGGDHPGRATHNALIVFQDGSYFELIAWKEPAPQERWWQLLQSHGEGIVDYALLPASTAATVAEAAERGLRLEGPTDGGRIRPDGERLRWQTARPPSSDLPFLCGDITPRALRVPEGDARLHPNGALGVASLAIAVRDLDATLKRYRALLGVATAFETPHVGQPVVLPGSGLRVAVIALGGSSLIFASPYLQASAAPTAHGSDALAHQLASRGEGPYGLVLNFGAPHSPDRLDPRKTHGALIEKS